MFRATALLLHAKGAEAVHARDLHAAGVGGVIAGKVRAIEQLREATRQAPAEWTYWNDLSAALYVRGREEGNTHELVQALAAADRGLRLSPRSPDALFNRAIILEGLDLHYHALSAWNAYLQVDGVSEWAREARQRSGALRDSFRKAPDSLALLNRSHAGDPSVLGPLVASHPEETRRRGETVLLGRWARERTAGRDREADGWLADARTIGGLLRVRRREALLAEAVAAIDDCTSSNCKADLAEAHRMYDEARQMYAARHVMESLPRFRAAAKLFRVRGSPMSLVADYYAANCLEDASDATASSEIEHLLAAAPEKYAALRAQLCWELAVSRARSGRLALALDAYTEALVSFTGLGERANANRMRDGVASIHAMLGRPIEAWKLRSVSLLSYSKNEAFGELQRALELAGRTEAIEGHWGAAASLFALATDDRLRVNPRTHVNAMLWRALAVHRDGFAQEARRRLTDARRFALSLSDAALRETALEDLAFAEATVVLDSDPAAAAAILDRYLASHVQRQRTVFLPNAQLERARAARRLSDPESAERFYRAALMSSDTQRRDVFSSGIVDAYFSTATAAANELADLLDSRGRKEAAFGVLEQGRGRALLERLAHLTRVSAAPLTSEEIRKHLPPRTLVVSYLVLREEMLVFTISKHEGVRATRARAGIDGVQSRIEQLRDCIDSDDDERANRLAEELHELLVAPIADSIARADTLVLVLDPILESLPFAMLREPGGTRLVERAALVRAPSASVFARGLIHAGSDAAGALVIGNPAFDRTHFPTLEPLPVATREASDVARRYVGTDLLIGERATATRFLRMLPSARLVHVATHAMASRYDPMRSFLLFAPDSEHSGVVDAEQITRSVCKAELVVLAGCRTAFPAETPSDIGTISLAFVAAGAQNVIGTLWNVEDEHGAAFSRLLHAELVAGVPAAEAMRRAQRWLQRSQPLRVWSAYTLIGSGR
ncbi:MAG TPA: CHAT domain-containing protein [Thermoanaerobaculia bacterium]|nr:CHAT domain-containing protein [Thermoanaerobaculia bacterium]